MFFCVRNVSEPVTGRATNNRGEIEAARRAISDAGRNGVQKLRINTDSNFLKQSVEQYMPNWQRNNYTKANGEPVVNADDFRGLDRAMKSNPNMEVTFNHVPAHAGNRGNECADRLAKEGSKRYY